MEYVYVPKCEITEKTHISDDVTLMKIGNTTYTVVSKYVGTQSILDIVKNAIRRDVEKMLYEERRGQS